MQDIAASCAARLLGAGEDLEPVKRGLIRRAEGNPLFLEEMARALVETGRLAGQPTRLLDWEPKPNRYECGNGMARARILKA